MALTRPRGKLTELERAHQTEDRTNRQDVQTSFREWVPVLHPFHQPHSPHVSLDLSALDRTMSVHRKGMVVC